MRRAGNIMWTSLFLLVTACHQHNAPPGKPPDAVARDGPPPVSASTTPREHDPETTNLYTTANSQTTVVAPPDTIPEYYIPEYKAKPDNLSERSLQGLGAGNLSADNGQTPLSGLKPYQSYIREKYLRVNKEAFLVLQFDNDIFDNTDYYYTSGEKIEFYHPALEGSPFFRLMCPGYRGSVLYYSISLVQNLYTPVDPDQAEVQYGDRPFSAYLYLGQKMVSNDVGRHLRLTSELDMGVMGPAALGGFVQKAIHNIDPIGWSNQIGNDIVANYSFRADKGIVNRRHTEVIVQAGLEAGTLYDNLSSGAMIRIGRMDSYFTSIFPLSSSGKRIGENIRYYFTLSFDGKFVVYDATLQGGLFNKSNVYHIPAAEVEHTVLHARAGIGLGIGRLSLEADQVFLTPEFKGGRSHMWFRLRTTFRL